MTVNEACEFFAGQAEVLRVLEPLRAVGLGYMKLGQPVPTLSGGEAQRLKLAGHLAEAGAKSDGPERKQTRQASASVSPSARSCSSSTNRPRACTSTTSRRCCTRFEQLIERGHSIIVIEHNLDVIRAADWIIDLGPEGGDAGGEIVCVGTPEDVAKCERSHTGKALRSERRLGDRRRSRQCARPITDHRSPNHHNPHPQRARAQPQDHRRPHPARQVHGHHRHQRQRQEHAGVRHSLRRGPTPLSRIAQRLRAAVRPARVAARRGRDLRHPADGGHRTTHEPRRTQEHRRDRDGGLSFPAAAVREARHAVLSRLRHPDPAADAGGDRRADCSRNTAVSASSCSRR